MITRALVLKVAAGAVATAAAGAVLVVVLSPAGATGAARSWIDDPLPGARLPLGVVDIIAHGADPDGVAAVELAVNGAVTETQDVTGGPTLATVRFDWNATEPGAAELVVRTRDGGGEWGAAAHATVYIGGIAPAPTTPAATPSAEPGPSPTTTTAPPPCTTITSPGLVSPAAGATVGSVSPVLRWSYSGPCPINGFALELGTDRDISRVLRSTTTASGVLTWQVAPPLFDCQRYYWRVRATLGGTPGPWSPVSSFVVRVGSCP
jgi:hypothetical protein